MGMQHPLRWQAASLVWPLLLRNVEGLSVDAGMRKSYACGGGMLQVPGVEPALPGRVLLLPQHHQRLLQQRRGRHERAHCHHAQRAHAGPPVLHQCHRARASFLLSISERTTKLCSLCLRTDIPSPGACLALSSGSRESRVEIAAPIPGALHTSVAKQSSAHLHWLMQACSCAGACRQVVVQWTTRDAGTPVVQVGTASGAYTITVAALSATYTRAQMAGEPANTVGYFDPVRTLEAFRCCLLGACAWDQRQVCACMPVPRTTAVQLSSLLHLCRKTVPSVLSFTNAWRHANGPQSSPLLAHCMLPWP